MRDRAERRGREDDVVRGIPTAQKEEDVHDFEQSGDQDQAGRKGEEEKGEKVQGGEKCRSTGGGEGEKVFLLPRGESLAQVLREREEEDRFQFFFVFFD